ncbi:MAG: hypothetical protein WC284_08835 [Candidimonas sp.]
MNYALLYQGNDEWQLFQDGKVIRLPPYSALKRPTLVLTNFSNAVSGLVALEGNPAHATPLIEKRLRSEGMIDQGSKILLHQIRLVGKGYQALYTAVSMDEWQRLFSWSESQPDHCLLFAQTSLFWSCTTAGEARVYYDGKSLTFIANLKHQMLYASVITFSASTEDIEVAVQTLAERVKEMLAREYDGDQALRIGWAPISSLSATEAQRLADDFAQRSLTQVELAPLSTFTDEQNNVIHSALPALCASLPLSKTISSSRSRWMYMAERSLPWASLASLLLAVALVSQATSWTLSEKAARQATQAEIERRQPIEQRIAQLQMHKEIPSNYRVEQRFIERSLTISQRHDPVEIIETVRHSSTSGIRILRTYLADSLDGKTDVRSKFVVVEGVVEGDSNIQSGSLLARFVGSLRNAGYHAIPTDGASASGAAQLPIGFFSYQLRPITDTKSHSSEPMQ